MFELIFYMVLWIGGAIGLLFIVGTSDEAVGMSFLISGFFTFILMLVITFMEVPTTTVTEYDIIEVIDTFVVYEIDGIKYSEEFENNSFTISNKNKIVITETTYDESIFINSIGINAPTTDVEIYLKVLD